MDIVTPPCLNSGSHLVKEQLFSAYLHGCNLVDAGVFNLCW